MGRQLVKDNSKSLTFTPNSKENAPHKEGHYLNLVAPDGIDRGFRITDPVV
jgi:hypothetical protein